MTESDQPAGGRRRTPPKIEGVARPLLAVTGVAILVVAGLSSLWREQDGAATVAFVVAGLVLLLISAAGELPRSLSWGDRKAEFGEVEEISRVVDAAVERDENRLVQLAEDSASPEARRKAAEVLRGLDFEETARRELDQAVKMLQNWELQGSDEWKADTGFDAVVWTAEPEVPRDRNGTVGVEFKANGRALTRPTAWRQLADLGLHSSYSGVMVIVPDSAALRADDMPYAYGRCRAGFKVIATEPTADAIAAGLRFLERREEFDEVGPPGTTVGLVGTGDR